MRRVLVIRPEPGASLTAEKLRQMHLAPVVLPLTRIEALSVEHIPDPADFAAMAITSPNAARHAPADLVKAFAKVPAYAVGAATGAVSRLVGLNVIDESAGDAAGLHRLIGQEVSPGSKILVLCGHVRRNVLEQGLLQSGYRPRIIESYDTLPTDPGAAVISSVLGGTSIDVVMLHSSFAAEEFMRFLGRMDDIEAFSESTFIAISSRIRSYLPESLRDRVIVAAEPNEEAMLSLL